MLDTELMPMSEPARRLEIFTGAGRRRRWSDERKAEIVSESLSEASVSVVARRHGLTPQQLFTWRRQARVGRVADKGPMNFAAVVVAPAVSKVGETEVASSRHGQAEIEYCGVTIRVSVDSDGAVLRTVLQVVKALS